MPRPSVTACCAGVLCLAGAAALGWHATRGAGGLTASHPHPDELKAEIDALNAHLASLKEGDLLKRAVYQGMVEQARKNLRENPLAMDWKEFYRTSRAMQVDEEVLIRNILARLVREAGLSPRQHQEVLEILHEERARARAEFRRRHADQIEANRLGDLPEGDMTRLAEEIAGIRNEARAASGKRFGALLREEQLRLINLHLRNGFTCGYGSDGTLLGGIGVPESYPEALDQTH